MYARQTSRRRRQFSVAPAILVSLMMVLLAACAGQPMPVTVTGKAIRVENPMARPSMAGQNSAVYFTVVNPGRDDDRLLAVSGDVADAIELHETVNDNGVMRMTPHPEGFVVPSGSTVTLAPGGKHVMMMGLHQDLIEGQTITLTLTFEKGGEIQMATPVMDMASGGMTGMNMTSSESMPAAALPPPVGVACRPPYDSISWLVILSA